MPPSSDRLQRIETELGRLNSRTGEQNAFLARMDERLKTALRRQDTHERGIEDARTLALENREAMGKTERRYLWTLLAAVGSVLASGLAIAMKGLLSGGGGTP